MSILPQRDELGGRRLVSNRKVARQADGAASSPTARPPSCTSSRRRPQAGIDFSAAVHYQEKTFAAGKIPGGFSNAKAADREGGSDLPPDRPPDPPAVRTGFPQ